MADFFPSDAAMGAQTLGLFYAQPYTPALPALASVTNRPETWERVEAPGSWRSARTWQRRGGLRLDRLTLAGSKEECNSCRYKAHNQCNDQETPDRHRFGLRCFRSLHGSPAFSAITKSRLEWLLVGSAGVYVEGVGVTFGSIPAATTSIIYWDAFGLQKFATFDWSITSRRSQTWIKFR
jgi:hypothetical protein